MAEDLHTAFAQLREAVLDDEHLVRALASGRRRGQPAPRWRRIELRYVDLKAGRHLQLTTYDDTQAHVTNRQDAAAAVDELLAEPFANWHVETATHTHQLRVTKKGEPLLHTSERAEPVTPQRTHDHTKQRLLPEDHPVLKALGISDAQGRVKPSRQAKYRQVEEFLRALAVAIEDATRTGKLREPTPQDPLRVVDLGCGNAYLTFAAHAWLSEQMPVRLVGIDVKEQSRRHNTEVAEELGLADELSFVAAGIRDATLPERPDVVLALHACDTATDDALALGIARGAAAIAVVPCCQAEVARQLDARADRAPADQCLIEHPLHRRELGSHLTNVVRALCLEACGYKVTVTELVGWEHSLKNELLLARRVFRPERGTRATLASLLERWRIEPALVRALRAAGQDPCDPCAA
jgi:SAM-dependent methyltransferase